MSRFLMQLLIHHVNISYLKLSKIWVEASVAHAEWNCNVVYQMLS